MDKQLIEFNRYKYTYVGAFPERLFIAKIVICVRVITWVPGTSYGLEFPMYTAKFDSVISFCSNRLGNMINEMWRTG